MTTSEDRHQEESVLLESADAGVQLREIVGSALERRRTAIVYSLARRFLNSLEIFEKSVGTGLSTETTSWLPIESLSQLRAEVGGRFQNLRQRWVASGFPLREHRGDRKAEADLDYNGWIELSAWIARQGFEVRLSGEDDECLFYVRQLDNKQEKDRN